MKRPKGHGRVLVVEDSRDMLELVAVVLSRAGYRVRRAPDGERGLALFSEEPPDLVLLDLGLPGITGWEVLDRLRHRSSVPISLMTGLADDFSKVRGLNGGADDYIVKPVSPPELVARVGALLRRARRPPALEVGRVYDDGVVRVSFDSCRVEVGGREVRLTPLEYRLLVTLIRHPGQVLSRDQLLREVWHDDTGGPGDHVKTYVGYLRRKLRDAVDDAQIETVRGFGYRWRPAS